MTEEVSLDSRDESNGLYLAVWLVMNELFRLYLPFRDASVCFLPVISFCNWLWALVFWRCAPVFMPPSLAIII